MTRIRNTAREVRDNPALGFFTALDPEGIQAQEAEGQQEVLTCSQIPCNCNLTDVQLLLLGFTQLGKKPEDDIFRDAVLPPGWKKLASSHPLHSTLYDEKGRRRARIFYKAAFYDRRADIHFNPRYGYSEAYNEQDQELVRYRVVDAGDTIIFTCEERVPRLGLDDLSWREARYQGAQRLRTRCADFLRSICVDPEATQNPMLGWECELPEGFCK